MAHVFLTFLAVLFISSSAFAGDSQPFSKNLNKKPEEFWPPDLVPHPHLPNPDPGLERV